MLEQKLRRAERRRDNLYYHRRRFDSKEMDENLPPSFLRRTHRSHKQIEGERQYKPRSDYSLHVVGTPEFREDGEYVIKTKYRHEFYRFAAQLPGEAQELLVDHGLLVAANPNSSVAFQAVNAHQRKGWR